MNQAWGDDVNYASSYHPAADYVPGTPQRGDEGGQDTLYNPLTRTLWGYRKIINWQFFRDTDLDLDNDYIRDDRCIFLTSLYSKCAGAQETFRQD